MLFCERFSDDVKIKLSLMNNTYIPKFKNENEVSFKIEVSNDKT